MMSKRILFCLLISSSLLQSEDFTFNADKKAHFAVSFVLGMATYTYIEHTYKNTYSSKKKILLSTGIATAPGIIKEIMDEREKDNTFDNADLFYDVLGAFSGSVLSHYISQKIIINPKEKYISISYKF